ncbi:uncharacterized protein LOC118200191 [Stegodyphus dumicola]|uniref:uncharacterized protein LOC118200191 n=1 Tax=Stegodyphus dumicola TaxID=202533 RepID=UPI0015AEF237|nr:uncharacterized protein LOC118200191 [Stegodyphus dumicola]
MCGVESPGLTGVNSLSFRSRSARGSLKSASNVCITKQEETKSSNAAMRRQRTMLSQTSWRSLPLMPTLFRSFSSKHQKSVEDSMDSPPADSDCGFCRLFKPRPVSSGVAKSEGTVTRLPNPSSFDDIKEESQEDDANADTKLMDRSSVGDIEEEALEETENFVSRTQSPCFVSTQKESQEDAV